MPSQGAFPGAGDRAFGLIETLKWSREDGYVLFQEHMRRLGHSAETLAFAFPRDLIERRLADFATGLSDSPSRVRMVLLQNGSVELSASPLGIVPTLFYRVVLAEPRHRSDDPWLRHKTTMRDRYERPLAAAVASAKADEVVFLNERDELCEGARSNIFVRRDGQLLTPPLSCGLLPGTLRVHLLASGQAKEAVLHVPDLAAPAEWYMGNSVRNLVPASLIVG